MVEPFLGSEALAEGRLTRHALRHHYGAVYPDVYVPRSIELSAVARANAAWLWSRRRAVIAGQSAAALHGAKWVDGRRPAELLYAYRRPPRGIHTWSDSFADDEIQTIADVPVTTPARTALDIASRYRLVHAVAAIDSLSRATDLRVADAEILAARYKGRRGIRAARRALSLVDAGAESPRETWLRLALVQAGFPPPRTQIPVYDEYGQLVAELDMGWEEMKLAVEYDGDQHWTNRRQFTKDITRHEVLSDLGWIVVRVTAEDTEGGVLARVTTAWSRRTCTQGEILAS